MPPREPELTGGERAELERPRAEVAALGAGLDPHPGHRHRPLRGHHQPAGRDPAIQRAMADQITAQVFRYLDVQGLTIQLVDALAELGPGPVLATQVRARAGLAGAIGWGADRARLPTGKVVLGLTLALLAVLGGALVLWYGEGAQDDDGQEHQSAAGTEQAGRLGDPTRGAHTRRSGHAH